MHLSGQTNRCRSLSASSRRIIRYMRLTSVVRGMRCKRKRMSTSVSEECTVGPTRSLSLRDMPDEECADASNTARTLVVVLDILYTACMGK